MRIIVASTIGYPMRECSSGMASKLIPYTPAMEVRGMKILIVSVSVRITSLERWLSLERDAPRSPAPVSRYDSSTSSCWTA